MIQYIFKVLYILSGARSKLVFLLIVFVFTSLAEALGIGLIGPFVHLAMNPQAINDVPFLQTTYQLLGITSNQQFIAVAGFGIAVVFMIKAFLYFLARAYISSYSFNQYELLIYRMLNAYIRVPYTFYLAHNTANLVKNIIVETNQFLIGCLTPLLNTAVNVILFLSLLVLLAKTDLFLLVFIAGAFLPVIIVSYLLKQKFMKWGKTRSQSKGKMMKILNHVLGGIKESRIIGCEPYFEAQMRKEGHEYARSSSLYQSFQTLPRILIETSLVIIIVSFIAVRQFTSDQSTSELNAILGVFAVASLRLIPAGTQILQSLGQMQSSAYTLDTLYLELKDLEAQQHNSQQHNSQSPYRQAAHEPLTLEQDVHITGLTYRYPGTEEPALKDISLRLGKGESIALIGRSGAGKTTLVDTILGLLTPESGDISVDGTSIYTNLRAWQNLIGYIPQSIFLTDDTLERNIAFGIPDQEIDPRQLERAIAAAQLQEFVEQLPEGIKTVVGERGVRLSGGQRQRIGIARALYHEREILILDEATSALDNETEQRVSEAIQSLSGKKTMIIIAHRLSTVKHCDRVYKLEKGRIVESGTFQQVVLEQQELA